MSKKDQEKRRRNYAKLIKAGYNSYEANRFKDLTKEKMDILIEKKQSLNADIETVIESKISGIN